MNTELVAAKERMRQMIEGRKNLDTKMAEAQKVVTPAEQDVAARKQAFDLVDRQYKALEKRLRAEGVFQPTPELRKMQGEHVQKRRELNQAEKALQTAKAALSEIELASRMSTGFDNAKQAAFRAIYEDRKATRAEPLREELLATFAAFCVSHGGTRNLNLFFNDLFGHTGPLEFLFDKDLAKAAGELEREVMALEGEPHAA